MRLPPSGSRPIVKAGWSESAHPRAFHGEFTETGHVNAAGGSVHPAPAKILAGAKVTVGGKEGTVVQDSGKHVTVRHAGGVLRSHPKALVKFKAPATAKERRLPGRKGKVYGRRARTVKGYRQHSGKVNGKVIKAADKQGVMVALFPPQPETAREIARPGGEPWEELHVTLCYLGGTDGVDPDAFFDVVKEFAAGYPQPEEARIGGVGHFDAGECTYASIDCPYLNLLQANLQRRLVAAGFPVETSHGFSPHLTLAYDEDDAEELENVPSASWPVECIVACYGEHREPFRLKGDPTVLKGDEGSGMAVSGGGDIVPTSPLTTEQFGKPGTAPLSIKQAGSKQRCKVCGKTLVRGKCPDGHQPS